jgi:hypothetical protein
MAAEGVICQLCGIEAPSRHVEFHQNVGALVMRFHRQVRGRLCKSCIHKKYWKMTGTTLAVGWLGFLSLVIAPIFIISNTIRYPAVLGMPPVPPGARVLTLDQQSIARIRTLHAELIARLNQREDLATVARDIAARTNVTRGQVVKYVAALNNSPSIPRAQGFPVVPLPQPPAAAKTSASPTSIPLEPDPPHPPPTRPPPAPIPCFPSNV